MKIDVLFVNCFFRKHDDYKLSRSQQSFFLTWCDDNENNEISENWNDYLNKIDESSRAFKSKRSVSLEKSRMNSWKNWFEMIDENNSKKEL